MPHDALRFQDMIHIVISTAAAIVVMITYWNFVLITAYLLFWSDWDMFIHYLFACLIFCLFVCVLYLLFEEREKEHISALAINLSQQMDFNNSLLEQVNKYPT